MKVMHGAVFDLTASPAAAAAPEPEAEHFPRAVTVRKSLASKDHVISMIEGKSYRTFRRHLPTNGLTPDEYRARYGLAKDYPMVAPSYSEARRDMAVKIELGRKPGQTSAKKGGDACGVRNADSREAHPYAKDLTAEPARQRSGRGRPTSCPFSHVRGPA